MEYHPLMLKKENLPLRYRVLRYIDCNPDCTKRQIVAATDANERSIRRIIQEFVDRKLISESLNLQDYNNDQAKHYRMAKKK